MLKSRCLNFLDQKFQLQQTFEVQRRKSAITNLDTKWQIVCAQVAKIASNSFGRLRICRSETLLNMPLSRLNSRVKFEIKSNNPIYFRYWKKPTLIKSFVSICILNLYIKIPFKIEDCRHCAQTKRKLKRLTALIPAKSTECKHIERN